MKNKIFRSHHHCVFKLDYHLVLVTKYQKKCFTNVMRKRLFEIAQSVCEKWDIKLSEFGGESDHIHLLISAHPAMNISTFINNLKTVTSRMIRKEFKEHLSKYYWKPVLWTRAYCLLTTGGANIETIKKYIEKQGMKNPRRMAENSSPPKLSTL